MVSGKPLVVLLFLQLKNKKIRDAAKEVALPQMRYMAPSSSGLGHSPFKAKTRDRTPLASPSEMESWVSGLNQFSAKEPTA